MSVSPQQYQGVLQVIEHLGRVAMFSSTWIPRI
jgi:hypothetical protein